MEVNKFDNVVTRAEQQARMQPGAQPMTSGEDDETWKEDATTYFCIFAVIAMIVGVYCFNQNKKQQEQESAAAAAANDD